MHSIAALTALLLNRPKLDLSLRFGLPGVPLYAGGARSPAHHGMISAKISLVLPQLAEVSQINKRKGMHI